jgi:hypothetical protein
VSERNMHDPSPRAGRAIRRGEIPDDGVLSILREVESLHVTGVLRFSSDDSTGTIALERGQIAAEQEEHPHDPVERFLALRTGRYEVLQVLPTLHATSGDAERRSGVIGDHAVADLMAYCERAGLTGVLRLERQGVRAEAIYDRGELTGLVVDGSPEDAVEDVFAWNEGLFFIEAHIATPEMPEADAPPTRDVNDTIPAPPPSMRTDSTQTRLLRVVEMSLADVLRKREERRPSVRPTSLAPSPEEGRKDATVRVVFLGGSGDALVGRASSDDSGRMRTDEPSGKARRDPSSQSLKLDRPSQDPRRAVPSSIEPPAVMPRFAIAALLVLLLAGLAAFVVTLMRVE